VEVGRELRGAAVVHDITSAAPGTRPVSAYLVVPRRDAGRHPAVLFAHWFEPPNPTSSRLEFLGEAVSLARHGVVSLLPQLSFPWGGDPVGNRRDVRRIVRDVVTLRRGLDLLTSRRDVADGRVGIVGHDYGAMYSILTTSADHRIATAVYMAPDATFANWFNTFWLGLPPAKAAAYARLLRPYDPIRHIGQGPRRGELLQFAVGDFFIPRATALRIAHAAARPSFVSFYGGGHHLNRTARSQRDLFLGVRLGFLRAATRR
jgi:hypothetical protein